MKRKNLVGGILGVGISFALLGAALGVSIGRKSVETQASVGNYTTNASTFYNSISATSGKQLLGQLHDLMCTTHQTYTTYDDNGSGGYQQYTDQYYENGVAVSGYIYDFYSQSKWPGAWDPTSGSTTGGYNREHVWCQSLSGGLWSNTQASTRGGGADMHHVRPLEYRLNSTRNNNPYGTVSSRDSHKVYAKLGTNTTYALGGYYYDGVFEPLDKVKGDVARIVLYVYTHYNTYSSSIFGGYATKNGTASSYCGTLKLSDITATSSEDAGAALLKSWSAADPVDAIEQRRNEQAAKYQGNRNPFIDHPEYVDAIWSGGSGGDTSESSSSSSSSSSSTPQTQDYDADVIAMNGFGGQTGNSTITGLIEDTAPTNGFAVQASNYVPGTGQVRGNQSSSASNFYIYNTEATPADIETITVTQTATGTSRFTKAMTIAAGNSCQKDATAATSGITSSYGDQVMNYSFGNLNHRYFKLFSASSFTSYSVKNVEITITYKSIGGTTPVSNITITPGNSTINVGETVQLSAVVFPDNATDKQVAWSSENEDIASVNDTGLVTGVAAGTTSIYCMANDGSNVQASATIMVRNASSAESDIFRKALSTYELLDGVELTIGNSEYEKVMGAQANNNRTTYVGTFDEEGHVTFDNAELLTSVKIGSNYNLKTSANLYLYAPSSTSNYLRSEASPDADGNADWAISIDGQTGNASIIAQGTNTRNTIRYNNGSTIFSCYDPENNQQDVQLYVNLGSGVQAFIDQFMHMTDYTTNQGRCLGANGYYALAKQQLLRMGNEYAVALGTDSTFSAAKARMVAWASANGEVFNPTSGTFSPVRLMPHEKAFDTSLTLIMVLGGAGLALSVGYLIVKSKAKKN